MATSWQYNTSANMGSYGSITTMHMPKPATPMTIQVPSTPSANTSNSQYGAWFGSLPASFQNRIGTPGTASSVSATNPPPSASTNNGLTVNGSLGSPGASGSASYVSRSPVRPLGNVNMPTDSSATLNSPLKPNTNVNVSLNTSHTVKEDPTKEKFATLANRFGNGRILTPISSQYDQIMAAEEENNIHKRASKTPIHSPDISPRVEPSYRKMTYKEDPVTQRNTFENSFDSRNGMSMMANRRPGFERAATMQMSSEQVSPQSNGIPEKYDNVGKETNSWSSLQRSNTFTSADLSPNRFPATSNTPAGNRHGISWKHEPSPPPPSSSVSNNNGIPLSNFKPTSAGLSSNHHDSSDLSNRLNAPSSAIPDLVRPGYDRHLSQERELVGRDYTLYSASSTRSSINSQDGSRTTSSTSGATSSLGSSSVISGENPPENPSNSMYWLYGSRGRPNPPPTPYRPSTYMYKLDNSEPVIFPPSPPSGNPSLRSDFNSRVFTGNGTSSDVLVSKKESSPLTSPRSRLHALHTNNKYIDPVTEDPDYDNLSPADYIPSQMDKSFTPHVKDRDEVGNMINPYEGSRLGSPQKGILKKSSSYNGSRGVDFPIYSGVDASTVPSYLNTDMGASRYNADLGTNPLPPLSRMHSSLTPGPVRKTPSSSGKRVTFKLTPAMKEISPREQRESQGMMNMLSSFRFDPSLLEYSEG